MNRAIIIFYSIRFIAKHSKQTPTSIYAEFPLSFIATDLATVSSLAIFYSRKNATQTFPRTSSADPRRFDFTFTNNGLSFFNLLSGAIGKGIQMYPWLIFPPYPMNSFKYSLNYNLLRHLTTDWWATITKYNTCPIPSSTGPLTGWYL